MKKEKQSKKRWNWKEKYIRKTIKPRRNYRCNCFWCTGHDEKVLQKKLETQEVKKGIEDYERGKESD